MSAQPENFTLGVEEEYQIIDPHTGELSSSSRSLLRTAQQTLGEQAQPELQLSQVEAATSVCQDLGEVRKALTHMRCEMITAAEKKGKALVAAGTHPFSHWKSQRITPKERYKGIAEYYQQLAREPIFGCHIHVGLSDRETRLKVMNRARAWLTPLLALAANSPFWQGEDTGYASFRTVMWSRWPTSGQPQYFASLAEYDALLQALIATGCIEDATRIYWDIRLSERFDTIEFRVTDCCLTIDEAVMIAGLAQAVVQTCYEQVMNDIPFQPARPELLRAAHWRAARYGISDELVDVLKQRSLPAADLIKKMLDMLHPALEKSGNWAEVSELVRQTLQQGNGAMRQRAAYQKNACQEDIVRYMVSETRKGIFS
ncbi:MAG TPA: carboxylate-amine ligase [Ktedonobacteraceae bacterium]|nr:carboxylate-amine ligase [Ktedonobacteraceae bacterium]